MMIAPKLLCSCAALALAIPSTVYAQDAAQDAEGDPPQADRPDTNEIVVFGDRLRQQVDTAQAPILELGEDEIAAYGASSIADLVAAIEPQTGSNRGRGGGQPVFLVNGIRVASFREFRSYPSEAIRKVEVLPEETAQLFGFPPNRRVLNFILKDKYSAITAEVEFEQPDRGGYSVSEQELTLLRIAGGGRLNLNAEARDVSLLTEDERAIIQTQGSLSDVASDPDPAAFRSLIADSAQKEITANWAKAFLNTGSSLSVNATYERNDSLSLSGLNSVLLTDDLGNQLFRTFGADDPLERRGSSDTVSAALSYSRPIGDFQFAATADGAFSDSRTEIDRRAVVSGIIAAAADGALDIAGALPALADAGFDVAKVGTYSADTKLTLRGSPLFVPAGEVSTTFDLGYMWNRIDSTDSRGGSDVTLERGTISGGFNISVPVTSTRDDVLGALGSITLNGQIGFNDVSDFGTLYNWTAGANWEPFDGLSLQATYVYREVQPTLLQLGSPEITTLNVPFFDLVTGDTSLISVTTGGNRNLRAETQKDWNLSANWELPFVDGARFTVDYVSNRSENVSSSFPFLSSEIEAAFPGRITRAAPDPLFPNIPGTLLAIDQRPVDFFESRTKRISFGLTMRGRIGGSERRGGGTDGSSGAATNRPPAGGPPEATGGGNRRAGRPDFANISEEQREQMQAFRQRICADDGEAFLLQLAGAIENGETPAGIEGLDRERAAQMLGRVKNEDGTIDRERLAILRTRMCERGSDDSRAEGAQPSGRRPVETRGGPSIPGSGPDNAVRYFLNLTHSVEVDRQILIAQGGPLLDLLDGDSLSSFGTASGSSRLEAGVFGKGLGMRLSGRYTGSARIDGTGGSPQSNLFIDDLLTFDLRLFANLGEIFDQEQGVLKGMRLALRADNLFDGRRIVRDANGNIPTGFQPLLIDPTGRYLGIDLRKLF
ncbi:hypothetical protein [Pontixanthobacter sp.]|uniref:hypothetical protein n=1 Tax=Pontixanthobacter sp. TaxID=2792078 RepID=UPI003C799031